LGNFRIAIKASRKEVHTCGKHEPRVCQRIVDSRVPVTQVHEELFHRELQTSVPVGVTLLPDPITVRIVFVSADADLGVFGDKCRFAALDVVEFGKIRLSSFVDV
jgi:hypothetical protein